MSVETIICCNPKRTNPGDAETRIGATLQHPVIFRFTAEYYFLTGVPSSEKPAVYGIAMKNSVKLTWHKFSKLTEARSQFAKTPCVYIQTDARGRPIRVGKASKGLDTRYRGGTGYAIDAAMHGSGNLVIVAAVSGDLCGSVENELIWQGRRRLTYNNEGKLTEPSPRIMLNHSGTSPRMDRFESG